MMRRLNSIAGLRFPDAETAGRAGTSAGTAGGAAGVTTADRLAALTDQGIISAGNFLLTLTLARVYEPMYLAAFGIGFYVAMLFQGVFRAGFVLPAVLLDLGTFRVRAGELIAQHIVLSSATLASATIAAGILAACDAPAFVIASAVAAVTCLLLFQSMDFDRALLLRLNFRAAPLIIASAYLSILGCLAVASANALVSFYAFMTVLGLFGAARTLWCAFFLRRPDFRRTWTLLYITARRNLRWGAIGNLGATGYLEFPLFILGALAPAANTAAFVAMRSLTQPLQLFLRSLDVVDKLMFSRLRGSGPEKERSYAVSALLRFGIASSLFVFIIATFSESLIKTLYGPKYAAFAPTLVAWSVVTALTCCLGPLETIIYRIRGLKAYASIQLVSGACCIVAGIPLIYFYLDFGAVLACLLGTVIVCSGAAMLCLNFLVGGSRRNGRPS